MVVLGFSLSIFLAKPSDAVDARNQQMIELGLIDEVISPEDLGLDGLRYRPPQLNASLIDNLRRAQRAVAQLPENISVAVPLGTDSPVRTGELTRDNGDGRLNGDLEAIGSVNHSGQIELITPKDEEGMFVNERLGGGTLIGESFDEEQKLLADASGSFLQAQRVLVFDLVVRNRRNNKIYLVPNVVADAFCRDALNGVLNGTQRRSNIDVSRLRRR